MVNVGTGNVIIQDVDMSVPHKGVPLIFQRTYNSQSQHDVAGSDGTPPSLYGNGWTNTFDAHLSGNLSNGMLSVWDIDGARYDYTGSDAAGWTPSAGQHSTLVFDNSCGYLWTKKNGTTYYFIQTGDHPTTCPYGSAQYGGYWGRLYKIIGRNRNIALSFSYTWDGGNASPTGKVSAITVTTESGLTMTMNFVDVAGHRLLGGITFPDGSTTVAYGYDAQGNLNNVSRPPNNAVGARPSHSYGYVTQGSGGSIISWADSPRWAAGGPDGGVTSFAFTGSSPATATINAIGRFGTVNPVITDGTNSGALQAGLSTALYEYYDEYYTTGVSTPTFRDSDGHAMNWVVDSQGRPTQSQACTASTNGGCTGTWLVANETWDTDNNLAIEVDPRGNETDYLYDLAGNTTAIGSPYTTTSQGSFKPTRLYDYGSFNNVVAFCDESETHAMQGDWTPATTSIWANDSLCGSHTNNVPHWHGTYAYPTYEPFGELVSMTSPLGYSRTIAYAPAQQAGIDFGLPTSVIGASFAQVDGSTVTPTQTTWYDNTGNARCVNKGNGTTVLTYDALGRTTSMADPDDSSANAGSVCGKNTGQAGWNTQTTYSYYPDGTLQSSQAPTQRAGGVSTSYSYDLDGNRTIETHHYGCTAASSCTAGVTTKWYDGAGRLVEVSLPHDPSDYYSSPWLTRYLYDLSYGGTVAIAGASFRAYGNQFKTQEWVPPTGSASPTWLDQRGSASDAIDRTVTKYTFSPSSNTTLRATSMTYDATAGTVGRLTSMADPLGEITTYGYDAGGLTTSVQFSGDGGVTPNKSFVYDPNGRQTAATGAVYGTQTSRYDADGRMVENDEATTGSMTSAARVTYDYYPNGTRKDVNVASSTVNASPLMSYAYRADGSRTLLHVGYGQQPADFRWAYTDAGRFLSQSDPYTGTTMPNVQSPVTAGTTYPATTRSYDLNGQLRTLHLPETFGYTFTPDDEGQTIGWTAPFKTATATMTLTNTVRGENVREDLASGTAYSLSQSKIANGAIVRYKYTKGVAVTSFIVDPVNALITASQQEVYTQDSSVDPSRVDCGLQTKTSDFDAASRKISTTSTVTGGAPTTACWDVYDQGPLTTRLYSYDAENHHTVIQPKDGIGSPSTVSWDPTGHAYRIGSSLHYDGNNVLFITDASGALSQVKIEALADIDSTGHMVVLDRDNGGQWMTEHDNVFYGAVGLGSSVNRTTFQGIVPFVFPGSTNADQCTSGICPRTRDLEYSRLEGFDFAGVTFQGARAVETGSGQWTTPDSYAGDVHDPMSQKAFMWDLNNPHEYSDPTGFSPLQFENCSCDTNMSPYIPMEVARAQAKEQRNPLPQDLKYRDAIWKAAVARGVDPFDAAAIAAQESGGPDNNNGNANAIYGGGYGLFQIQKTADREKWFATHDWRDPYANALEGMDIYQHNLARLGDRNQALNVNNSGKPGGTDQRTLWANGDRLRYVASVDRHKKMIYDMLKSR